MHYHEHETEGGDLVSLELRLEPIFDVDVRELDDGTFIVGYLAGDDDCPSPEDCDGAGKIGTSNQRDARELNEVYQEALGLTSDWSRKVTEVDVIDELAYELDRDVDSLLRERPPEYQITDYRSSQQWREHDEREAERRPQRKWLKLPYRRRFDALMAEHRKNGDFGDPDAVLLDVYEHGGRVYHVGYNPSFPDRQWDCAYGGAVWVPDDALRQEVEGLSPKKRRAKMLEYAERLVESMNDWMNGGCYIVVTQRNDAEGNLIEHDDCGGYIGHKWAEEELEGQIKWMLEHPKEAA